MRKAPDLDPANRGHIDALSGEVRKYGHKSPERRAAVRRLSSYLLALWDAGWPQVSIAQHMGVTRQAIENRLSRVMEHADGDLPPVVAPPPPEVAAPTRTPRKDPLSSDEVKRLRLLYGRACRVNGVTPLDHPDRQASVEVTQFMAALVDRGVSCYRIGQALSITGNAVKFRLARHGYREAPPSLQSQTYRNRRTGTANLEKCLRGHDMTGDNVAVYTGRRGQRRVCRPCAAIRAKRYQARLAERLAS